MEDIFVPNKTLSEMQELIRPNIEHFYEMRESQDIAGLQNLAVILSGQMMTVASLWAYWNGEELKLESAIKESAAIKFLAYKSSPIMVDGKGSVSKAKVESDEICKQRTRSDLASEYRVLVTAQAQAAASKILHDDIKDVIATIRQIVSTLKVERGLTNG